jgi:hypothetical protein
MAASVLDDHVLEQDACGRGVVGIYAKTVPEPGLLLRSGEDNLLPDAPLRVDAPTDVHPNTCIEAHLDARLYGHDRVRSYLEMLADCEQSLTGAERNAICDGSN